MNRSHKFEISYTTSEGKERNDVVKAENDSQAIDAILESESLYKRGIPEIKNVEEVRNSRSHTIEY